MSCGFVGLTREFGELLRRRLAVRSLVTGELFAHTERKWPYAVAEELAANVTIVKWTPPPLHADDDVETAVTDEDDDDYGWT